MLKVERKIVLVTPPTRLAGVVAEHGTASQALFKMVRTRQLAAPRPAAPMSLAAAAKQDQAVALAAGADFDRLRDEDVSYQSVLAQLRKSLGQLAPVHVLDRNFLANYVFGPDDVVVTLGQDGLVANCAKYAVGRLIVGINADPHRIDGVLLPFTPDQAVPIVQKALRGDVPFRQVTLAQATLVDGQRLAFNDLFIGARTHVSARYQIAFAGQREPQSSSGLIVSTAAGSTGWLSSIINMSQALPRLAGLPSAKPKPLKLAWDDPRLVFVVREPFLSKTSNITITAGLLAPDQELVLESAMLREGVIFSDGIEADYLHFNTGAIATIRPAPERAHLVVQR